MHYGEPREMHDAVCAECGQECQVPFKPDQSRSVYCRECYAKKRPPEEIDIKLVYHLAFKEIIEFWQKILNPQKELQSTQIYFDSS